jgi:hypothetical protein
MQGQTVLFEGRAKAGKPLLDDELVSLALVPRQDIRVVFDVKSGKPGQSGAIDLLVATRGAPTLRMAPLTVPEPRGLALAALSFLAAGGALRRRA